MSSDYNQALIRLPELIALTGLKRSTIYLRLDQRSPYGDENFPRPVSLATPGKKGAVAWVRSEVLAWIRKIAASREAAQALPFDEQGVEKNGN